MKITGVVRIDLSSFVVDDLLLIGDAEVRHLHSAIAGAAQPMTWELWIGSVEHVEWLDDRSREVFHEAGDVLICGHSQVGVQCAVDGLRKLSDRSVA